MRYVHPFLNHTNLTFVIPALNEEARIEACIASIQREVPEARVWVVDNGSADNTATIASDYPGPIYVATEPRRGINFAREAGLLRVTSPYVAFIDADNRLPPGWLKAANEAFARTGNVVVASGPPVFPQLLVFTRLAVLAFYFIGWILSHWWPMVQGGNFIVDRKAFLQAGGFDHSVEFYGEDTATAMRMSEVGDVIFSLDLYIESSARRLEAEGALRAGTRYAVNYLWMSMTGRPWTKSHIDHREATDIG